jgi:methionyl-tRNA formyltransferase
MPQSDTEATHAPKLHTETCRIHFDQATATVHNFIRGLSPYPGAWTLLDGKTLKILRTVKGASAEPVGQPPGRFFSDGKNYLAATTRDGWVEILELQMEGKRRMPVREFLNGFKRDWIPMP